MKRILPIIIIILCAAYLVFRYVNKPHESMERSRVDFQMTAEMLFQEFDEDEALANEKYLDKVVQVSGRIEHVNVDGEQTEVVLSAGGLMGGVSCSLDPFSEGQQKNFMPGQEVTFKCNCTGFLMDVVLQRCIQVD